MRSPEEDQEQDAPLGPVVLPVSITQEAEDQSLKRRFGVEQLPDFSQRHGSVHLTQSAGAGGPDRRRNSAIALFLLLLIVGAAAGYVHHKGGLKAALQGTPLEGKF